MSGQISPIHRAAGDSPVRPIPPADSIAGSVRALNLILSQIGGPAALVALRAGDATSGVDAALWGPAWEGARNFRDHFVVNLARHTRDEWRRDCAEIGSAQPKCNHAAHFDRALDERLRVSLEFAFRFLTPRHVCLLADALTLAFEPHLKPHEFSSELAASAMRARGSSAPLLDALVVGASGMHRFQPERVLASNQTHALGF